jgi:hypothetical protein
MVGTPILCNYDYIIFALYGNVHIILESRMLTILVENYVYFLDYLFNFFEN